MELIKCTRKDKLNNEEQLEFLDYLKHSLDNGFSLSNSLDLMPILWPKRRKLMGKVSQNMKEGASFSRELQNLGFSKTATTQINLAMQQGSLVECLTQLAILNRLKNEQIKKLKTELSYPVVLAVMMIILLTFMQSFVSTQFADSNDHTGDLLILGLILLGIFSIFYFWKILKLLAKQDYQSLRKLSTYPIIGNTVKLYVNYLLIYDIGLLLSSGFSLQKMCEYSEKLDQGSLQQYLGKKVGNQLSNGKSLTEIIKEEKFLPDELLILLQTGSTRHNLSNQCLVLGRSLFNDLTVRIEKLVINVQPVCFILIGFCIIGMYLKLLLPMYSMMQGI